jgi:hypothetical protein
MALLDGLPTWAVLVVALVGIPVLAVLLLVVAGVRSEDRHMNLTGPARNRSAAVVRRLLGLYVRDSTAYMGARHAEGVGDRRRAGS